MLTLGVVLFTVSTFVFAFLNRNDLLIFAAKQHRTWAVEALLLAGAQAHAPSSLFPESALLTYLESLQGTNESLPEGTALVEALLKAGASPNDRDANGWTALMLVSATGHSALAEALLDAGAEIDAKCIGNESTDGMTPLMIAALQGRAGVVRLLLDRGAKLHLKSTKGLSALHLAVAGNHLAATQALLKKGAIVMAKTIEIARKNPDPNILMELRNANPHLPVDPNPRRPAQFPAE